MSWNDVVLIALLSAIESLGETGQQSNYINSKAAKLKLIASAPESKSESVMAEQYRKWSRKAVRKYARAQERKWQNWAEALKK